jgi:7-cyano-7-deazaguanine synthase
MGHSLGINFYSTISCYQANDKGEACGKCDACRLRQKGFSDAKLPDQTYYA